MIISLTQETANVSNANFKSQSQSILSYLSFKYFQRFITWIPNFVDLCIWSSFQIRVTIFKWHRLGCFQRHHCRKLPDVSPVYTFLSFGNHCVCHCQLSVQSNPRLHWSCFTLLCDWSRKLEPPSPLISCKTKTNYDLVTRVFPPFTNFAFSLVSSDRLLWLLWF